jgi:hypothetical protein
VLFLERRCPGVLAVPLAIPARRGEIDRQRSGEQLAGDAAVSLDDEIIDTPDGPMTWAQWKKKNPVQIPSRRTKGKDLPVKVKRFTEPK